MFVSTYFWMEIHAVIKLGCIAPSLMFASCEFGLLCSSVLIEVLFLFSQHTSRRGCLCSFLIHTCFGHGLGSLAPSVFSCQCVASGPHFYL
jgi:hypothetical protein